MSLSNAGTTPQLLPQLTMDLRAHVQYVAERQVIVLMKEYLDILQQLSEEHSEALDKLDAALPPELREYVNLADHFTEEKGKRIRKAVMGRSNDCHRAIREELEKYSITFRQQPPSNP